MAELDAEPRLLPWLRAAAKAVTVEPLPGSDLLGEAHGVYVTNVDGSERALLATCVHELDAELIAEALRRLADDG